MVHSRLLVVSLLEARTINNATAQDSMFLGEPKDFGLHHWEPDGKGPHHCTRRLVEKYDRRFLDARASRRLFCFVFFVIWGFWKKESKASRTKSHSAGEERRGQPIDWESPVEGRHCPRHHRPRARRIALVCKVSTTEGAQGERHQSNSLGRLAWVRWCAFRLVNLSASYSNLSRWFRCGACSLLEWCLAQEIGTVGVNHNILSRRA